MSVTLSPRKSPAVFLSVSMSSPYSASISWSQASELGPECPSSSASASPSFSSAEPTLRACVWRSFNLVCTTSAAVLSSGRLAEQTRRCSISMPPSGVTDCCAVSTSILTSSSVPAALRSGCVSSSCSSSLLLLLLLSSSLDEMSVLLFFRALLFLVLVAWLRLLFLFGASAVAVAAAIVPFVVVPVVV